MYDHLALKRWWWMWCWNRRAIESRGCGAESELEGRWL